MNRMLRALVIGVSLIIGGTSVVLAADAWGEAVEGVQLRLSPATTGWPPSLPLTPTRPGELPAMDVQIRNRGRTTVTVNHEELFCADVEIDDVWYVQSCGTSRAKPVDIAPGSQGNLVRTNQNVASMFVPNRDGPPRFLKLIPGPHRIRLRNTTSGGSGVRIGFKQLTLVSNRITVNIPGSPATATPGGGFTGQIPKPGKEFLLLLRPTGVEHPRLDSMEEGKMRIGAIVALFLYASSHVVQLLVRRHYVV